MILCCFCWFKRTHIQLHCFLDIFITVYFLYWNDFCKDWKKQYFNHHHNNEVSGNRLPPQPPKTGGIKFTAQRREVPKTGAVLRASEHCTLNAIFLVTMWKTDWKQVIIMYMHFMSLAKSFLYSGHKKSFLSITVCRVYAEGQNILFYYILIPNSSLVQFWLKCLNFDVLWSFSGLFGSIVFLYCII